MLVMNLAKLQPLTYIRNITQLVFQKLTPTNLRNASLPAAHPKNEFPNLRNSTKLISRTPFQNPSTGFGVAQNGSSHSYSTISCCSSPAYINRPPSLWARPFCRYRSPVATLQTLQRKREDKLRDLIKKLSQNIVVPPHAKPCQVDAQGRACPICYPDLETLRQRGSLFSSWKGMSISAMVTSKPIETYLPPPQLPAAKIAARTLVDDKIKENNAVEEVASIPPPYSEDHFITILDLCNKYKSASKKIEAPVTIKQEPREEMIPVEVIVLQLDSEEEAWEHKNVAPEVVVMSSGHRCVGGEKNCPICYPCLDFCFG